MILVKPSHEILTQIDAPEMLKRIEHYGRVCYKSEDRITDDSAEKFVAGLIKRGHESVIEHVSLTVKFICDRGVSHELVRHRIAAYSMESTRYVSYSGGVTFVIPPWVDAKPGEIPSLGRRDCLDSFEDETTGHWVYFMLGAATHYDDLRLMGWTPQQARSVLPNSLKTEIVATMNLRQWRHVLAQRCSKAAHPQMQELMIPLRNELAEALPVIFGEVKV